MNLVRKYKISKITNKPLTEIEKDIIDFINGWIKDLNTFKHPMYPQVLFYMDSEGRWVFEETDDRMYIRKKDFWQILFDKYSLSPENISDIVEYLLLLKYNKVSKTVMFISTVEQQSVEEYYRVHQHFDKGKYKAKFVDGKLIIYESSEEI